MKNVEGGREVTVNYLPLSKERKEMFNLDMSMVVHEEHWTLGRFSYLLSAMSTCD